MSRARQKLQVLEKRTGVRATPAGCSPDCEQRQVRALRYLEDSLETGSAIPPPCGHIAPGSVPAMKNSVRTDGQIGVARSPVSGSIGALEIPGGGLNGLASR